MYESFFYDIVATRTDMCVTCWAVEFCGHCSVFAGSNMPINLLSANHRNAQNVRLQGILVVGGGTWEGGWAEGMGHC